MARLNYERAALVLVEAVYYGDRVASERWGISVRSINRYRHRLATDPELAELVRLKKEAFERDWIEEMPAAIRAGVRFLTNAFGASDPTDPDAIHAVAGAIKILAEVGLTKEIIDARLGRHDRSNREENRQVAAAD